jgi:hypothetical protein
VSTEDVKHRAKVALSPRDLLRLLGAPESVHLHRVIVSDDPEAVYVMVEHPSLPAVHPLAEAPRLDLEAASEVFEDITRAEHYA